nr:MAG TPA: tail tape measure [Caudoviricetes sp.]
MEGGYQRIMSNIDNRIVQMQFNNRQFESGAKTTLSTLDRLKKALNFSGIKTGVDTLGASINKALNMSGVTSGIENLNDKFSTMGIAWQRTIQQITDKAISAGSAITKALSTDAITDGLDEYTLKMDNIQTILTNTASKGTTLDDVNSTLNELNRYADETVYSFQDMTRAIGQFTTQGVDLETATAAIKGFSNLAAGTGTSNADLARAEYQMSQALSSGVVKLMDWKSMENAGGMGGEYFQKGLIESAKELGVALPEGLEEGLISFRESLSDDTSTNADWLSTDVLLKTLNKFAEDPTLKAAATEVKTFKQLIDTLKEALGTGWADSWEVIIGNFEEAKKLWTAVSSTLGDLINNVSNSRLEMLKEWKDMGGRDAAINALANAYRALVSVIEPAAQAIREVFPKMTGKQLADISKKLEKFTSTLSLTSKESSSVFTMFRNLSTAIKNILGAVGVMASSFKMVFPSSFRETLFSIVESISNLTAKIKFTTPTLGKLYTIGRGIFSVLSIAWEVLKAIFSTVKPLFKFMASSSGTLLNALAKVAQYIINLDESIKRTGILNTILGKVVSAFKSAFEWLKSVGASIRDTASAIIDAIGSMLDTAKTAIYNYVQGTILGKIIDLFVSAKNKIVEIAGSIKDAIEKIWGNGDAIDESSVSLGKSTTSLDRISKLLSGISKFFGKVKDSVVAVAEVFGNVFGPIFSALKGVFSSIFGLVSSFATSFFGNLDTSTLDTLSESLFKMVAGGTLVSFANTFKKSGETINKTATTLSKTVNNVLLNIQGIGYNLSQAAGSIKTFFDTLGDSAKALTANIKAKTLKEIAIAIGILAASMLVLSLINVDKLLPTIGAMASLFGELTGSMIALTKLTNDVGVKQMTAVSVAMVAMSIAVAILTGSLLKLSKIHQKALSNSALVLASLMGMLVGVSRTLSTDTKGMIKGAAALVIFAVAVKQLSKTVVALSTVPSDDLARGLLGALTLMAGLAAVMRIGQFDSMGPKAAIGIYIFAKAIGVLGQVVQELGANDMQTLGKGLGAMALSLAALVGALILIDKFAGDSKFVAMGLGMILFATGIKILASSIIAFGQMSWESIGKGLLTFAGAVGVMVGAVILITKFAGDAKFIGASLGMVIFAAGMAILGSVIQKFGEMSWESIAKGLIAFAGAMAIMVASIIILDKFAGSAKFLAMSAGLVIFSIGVKSIAGVIAKFGSMSLKEIGKGLLVFAGAMVIVVGSLILLSKLIPAPQLIVTAAALVLVSIAISTLSKSMETMAGLGIKGALVALLAMAGAFLVIGAAAAILGPLTPVILALGIAIAALGAGMALAAISILVFVTALSAFMALGSGAAIAVETLIACIANAIPLLIKAIGLGIVEFVKVIADSAGELASAALQVLISVLTMLSENIFQIVQLAADIMIGFMDGLASKLPDLVDSAVNLVITFIQSIADAIDERGDDFLDAVWSLFKSLGRLYLKILGKGKDLIGYLWNGIQNLPLVQKVKDFVSDAWEGIKDTFDDIYDIGAYLIEGLWDGIVSIKDWIVDKVSGLGDDILSAIEDIFGIASPSKKTAEMGRYLMEGLGNGIDDKANYAIDSAMNNAEKTLNAFNGVLSSPFQTSFTTTNAIRPIVDLSGVQNGNAAISAILNGHSVSVNGLKSSLTADLADDISHIDFSSSDIVDSIEKLQSDVIKLNDNISKMQVVMDTGVVVGQIATPLDYEYGRRSVYASRRN